MQESIPEHRRGQLEVTSSQPEAKKISFSDRIKAKLNERYKNSDFYKKLKESEEFKEYDMVSFLPYFHVQSNGGLLRRQVSRFFHRSNFQGVRKTQGNCQRNQGRCKVKS
jgi:hypothetical protein